MPSPSELPEVACKRERMYSDLTDVGDFRSGTLKAVRHKCGKPNRVCADPGHPGHGEESILSKKVAGKTGAANFRPGPALDKAQREVANDKRFRGLMQEIFEVNERICEATPVAPLATDQPSAEGKSGSSSSKSKRTSRPGSSVSQPAGCQSVLQSLCQRLSHDRGGGSRRHDQEGQNRHREPGRGAGRM